MKALQRVAEEFESWGNRTSFLPKSRDLFMLYLAFFFAPLLISQQSRGRSLPVSATAASVLRDLSDVLALVNPDTVYVTAPGDCHGDHDALGRFTTQAVAAMENPPALYYYLIHADRTDIWPERDAERFRLPPMAADHPLLRCAAERRPLPDGFPPAEKYSLIQSYTSQDPAAYNGYLLAFAKNDELVFRVERLPSRT